ncbi:MAG: 50S ribosomal protein L19 [Parachlamydiales bacterium]
MSHRQQIEELGKSQLKTDIPPFAIGDTISVHLRIIEGDKERVQLFTGTVIARKGNGISETFSLYRVAYGEQMERVFLLHSPRIAKIELVRKGKVRRAKLYYLRGTSGKKSKVKERLGGARATVAPEEEAQEAMTSGEESGA